MDLFSPGFVSALLAIIAIDLVLAGDNAIVIALVARRLPAHLQRMTIIAGTVGAVVVRVLMTLAIVWLLGIPWLQFAGGLLLIWIAWKLLAPDANQGHNAHIAAGQTTLAGAIRTIVVADAVMGLDNVLGVAGAAHGNMMLVIIGLLVSVPIMIFGSTLILKWVERFPAIIYLGAAILAWTAVKMIVSEPMLKEFFARETWVALLLYVVVIGGVVASGMLRGRRHSRELENADYANAPAPVATVTEAATADGLAPHASVIASATHDPVISQSAMPQSAIIQTAVSEQTLTHAVPDSLLEEEDKMMRVLVPVDGSRHALQALRHVLTEARRASDPRYVVLLNVQLLLPRHASRFLSASTRRSWRQERASKAMESAAEMLRQAGLSWQPVTATGDAAVAIAHCAQEYGVHKVVMGTDKKGALARFFKDSVTSRVMELSPVPVEIVAREEASALERFGIPAGIGAGLALLLLAEE
jgi:YjbE family integral membrane protein